MTFMLAVIFATMIPTYYAVKVFVKIANATQQGGESTPGISPYLMLAIIGCGFVCMGFLTGVLPSASWRPGHDKNYSPILFLIGGVVIFIASVYALFRNAKKPYGGAWVASALAGLHLAYSGANHVAFWWDKESVGIMATELATQAGIECKASYLIVRKEGAAFNYRCPTTYQFGNPLGEPFIPWPAYQEGTSEKLVKVMQKLESDVTAEMAAHKLESAQDEKK